MKQKSLVWGVRLTSEGTAAIDPRASIDPGALLGERVSVGPWTLIGPGVEIGDDCVIDAHVILRGPMHLGARNRIWPFAVLGEGTPAKVYGGEATTLAIGSENKIREGVTIHRGTVQDRGVTHIGSHNLFMPYAHIGHDSVVGDHCVFANNAAIAGHCRVGDYAGLGGYVGVPQYRRIGTHAYVGGMSLVTKDVSAFTRVAGHPARALGLNTQGLKRHGFDAATCERLQQAWRIVFRSQLRLAEALERLAALADPTGHIACFAESLREAPHGIVRPREQTRPEVEAPD